MKVVDKVMEGCYVSQALENGIPVKSDSNLDKSIVWKPKPKSKKYLVSRKW